MYITFISKINNKHYKQLYKFFLCRSYSICWINNTISPGHMPPCVTMEGWIFRLKFLLFVLLFYSMRIKRCLQEYLFRFDIKINFPKNDKSGIWNLRHPSNMTHDREKWHYFVHYLMLNWTHLPLITFPSKRKRWINPQKGQIYNTKYNDVSLSFWSLGSQ